MPVENPWMDGGFLRAAGTCCMTGTANIPCVWRIADSGEISNSPHTGRQSGPLIEIYKTKPFGMHIGSRPFKERPQAKGAGISQNRRQSICHQLNRDSISATPNRSVEKSIAGARIRALLWSRARAYRRRP